MKNIFPEKPTIFKLCFANRIKISISCSVNLSPIGILLVNSNRAINYMYNLDVIPACHIHKHYTYIHADYAQTNIIITVYMYYFLQSFILFVGFTGSVISLSLYSQAYHPSHFSAIQKPLSSSLFSLWQQFQS